MKGIKSLTIINSLLLRLKLYSRIIVFSLCIFLLLGCNPERDKWLYSPFSKTVIQLNITNDPPVSYFINTLNTTLIPHDFYESKPINIENSGRYNLPIDIDRPSVIRINFGEETYHVFVFEGDTTRINIEFVEGGYEIAFDGNTRAINTYYLEKKLEFGILESYQRYYFQATTRSGLNKIKQKIDSFTNRQLAFLENYTPVKKLSKRFIQFERSEIIYDGIIHKMQSPSSRFNMDSSDEYYNFLNEVEVDNQSAAFSNSYFRFLNEYFKVRENVAFDHNLSRSDGTQDLALRRIEIADKLLSDYNRDAYKLYNFAQIIPFHENEQYIDSLANTYQIKNYQLLLDIMGTRDEKGYDISKLEYGMSIPVFYTTDKNYALVSIRDFEDYILLIRFYIQQSESLKIRSLVLSSLENIYRQNNNIQFLNICIDCESQTWFDSTSIYNSNIINLMAEGNWNNALKRTYRIAGSQKYVMVNQDNQYIEMFETIPVNIQDKIDSLLQNSKYLEIQIQ